MSGPHVVHIALLPYPGCPAKERDAFTTTQVEDCTCVTCLRQLLSNEQKARVDVRKIVGQGVQIYTLFWKAFELGLRADKRGAAAKKMAALKVATEGDMGAADELLRDTFKYDPKHPERTAPAGFYPLLGMCLALRNLQGTLGTSSGFDGTFAGYFFEFCKSVEQFDDEVSKKIHRTTPTLAEEASKILHDVPPLPHYPANRIHAYKKQRDSQDYPEAFYVQVGGCCVRTWEFGSVRQCVIDIDGGDARVALLACDSATSALEHGIVWAEAFEEKGPPSVEQLFANCFQQWPTLYRTRIDVIDHVLFAIGNGYAWCRGCLISGGPEDHLGERHRRRRTPDPAPGPEPDDGGPRDFYPVSDGFSNICRVPDNVTDAWLQLAYEAAVMLRDRSQAISHAFHGHVREPSVDENDRQQKNRKTGARIVAKLEKRFGDRVRRPS